MVTRSTSETTPGPLPNGRITEVVLSAPRGFCAGVVRAVDIVDLALARFGAPVYVKHQIVHNPYVVASLEKKGAITVEDVNEIPEGATVVFSAHGSAPDDFAQAKARNLRVIDATCPLVTKVHNEARKSRREGKRIVLVGHRGHQEVKGTMGQTDMALVDDHGPVNTPEWSADSDVVVLTQTTLSVDDTAKAVAEIQRRFPKAQVRNDICYATTNRQEAVKAMTGRVDIVLVIGAENSSNCNRLREVAEAAGIPAYLINSADELRTEWLEGKMRVGVTSGASTPEVLVDEVVRRLNPDRVSHVEGATENITFVLPKELRTDNGRRIYAL